MASQETEVDAAFREAHGADDRLLRAYEAGSLRDVLYGNPITQLLMRRTAEEAAKAKEQLLYVDPSNTKEIVELQIMGRRESDLRLFLEEALQAGDAESDEFDADVERDTPRGGTTLR